MNAAQAVIEADKDIPLIRIPRDFQATPAQLTKAHTDPELFARWVGPDGMVTRVVEWDARNGGSSRYIAARDDPELGWLASGTETGVDQGYAKLDKMVGGL
jgi:uncharacterized protein YndB with AHSA1/START domain